MKRQHWVVAHGDKVIGHSLWAAWLVFPRKKDAEQFRKEHDLDTCTVRELEPIKFKEEL